MKYWYFTFDYENQTTGGGSIHEAVVQSIKDYFPLKEVRKMTEEIVISMSEIDSMTNLDEDDYTIMITNQVQINQEDFDVFNKEFEKK